MNSCVAGQSVAEGHVVAISATPVSSKSAELLYDPRGAGARSVTCIRSQGRLDHTMPLF